MVRLYGFLFILHFEIRSIRSIGLIRVSSCSLLRRAQLHERMTRMLRIARITL